MFFKSLTRKRSSGGVVGPVVRSIGYLQGGYKDANIFSKIQLFNTVTQTGALVYDTGYARYYTPGLSGDAYGYFSINVNVQFSKFTYATASASVSFTTIQYPATTSTDYGTYSFGWIYCSANASWTGGVGNNYVKVTYATDTPVTKGAISVAPLATTRQALANKFATVYVTPALTQMIVLNHTNETAATYGVSSVLTGIQVPCGMCVSDTYGFLVGIGVNAKFNFSGASIISDSLSTSYTYNFGESHSISTDVSGYMMAGYNDTSGRYGGSQHGLCQKITLANSAITTLSDLVLAQSSGQMMQGY